MCIGIALAVYQKLNFSSLLQVVECTEFQAAGNTGETLQVLSCAS